MANLLQVGMRGYNSSSKGVRKWGIILCETVCTWRQKWNPLDRVRYEATIPGISIQQHHPSTKHHERKRARGSKYFFNRPEQEVPDVNLLEFVSVLRYALIFSHRSYESLLPNASSPGIVLYITQWLHAPSPSLKWNRRPEFRRSRKEELGGVGGKVLEDVGWEQKGSEEGEEPMLFFFFFFFFKSYVHCFYGTRNDMHL